MANTIRLKSGSGSNPSASDLVVGEVALRTDGNPKLFTKNDAGNVLEVGLDSLNDKLPLTGGTLTGDVKLNDNVKALFGTGLDLEIYHDGSHSFLQNTTGLLILQDTSGIYLRTNDLRLQSDGGSETYATLTKDGAVALNFDNSTKFATTSGGISVTGDITGTGHLDLGDDAKLKMGASDDLEIFHSGGNSFIANSTGYLLVNSEAGDSVIRASNDVYLQPASGEFGVKATANGSTELYYDNSKKFETTSTGVKATGRLKQDVDSSTVLPTSYGVYAYTPYDHELEIDNNTRGNEGSFAGIFFNAGADSDGSKVGTARISAVETGNYKADLVFSTRNTQFTEKLRIKADGSVQLPNDNQKLQIGVGQDLWLYHTGTDSIIQNYTGELKIAANQLKLKNKDTDETYISCVDNGAVELYYDNINRLQTTSTGIATDTIRSGGLSFPRVQTGGLDLMTFGHGGANTFGELDCIDGMMRIKAGEIRLSNRFGNVDMINCFSFGAVELFHNGTKRIETTSSGATVTGTLTATTFSGSGASLTNIPAGQLTGTLPALDGSNLTGLTVNNANTIDNLDSTQFLRSDAADTASGDITFTDNTKAKFGTGNDLEIYHDGTNTIVENKTGQLQFIAAVQLRGRAQGFVFNSYNDQEGIIKGFQNGAAELYYDGSKKFETTSTGATITGNFLPDITDTRNLGSSSKKWASAHLKYNLYMADNATARFGDSDDLQIYHDGSHSRIDDAGTGALIVSSSKFQINNAAGNEVQAFFLQNGASALYYDNSKKLHTDSFGVVVSGGLALDGDNLELRLGNGQDLKLYHDGSHSYVKTSTGDLRLECTSDDIKLLAQDDVVIRDDTDSINMAEFIQGGAVKLYYDGVLKLDTTASAVRCNDNLIMGNHHIELNDNSQIMLGNAPDMRIYHDGSHSYITATTGDLTIVDESRIKLRTNQFVLNNHANNESIIYAAADGEVSLYHNGVEKFTTRSDGAIVQGVLTTSSNIRVSGEIDLGTSNGNKFMDVCLGDNYGFYLRSTSGEGQNHEMLMLINRNQGAKLYYDAAIKFETTSDGATISGSALFADNNRIKLGGSASTPDTQFWHDGSNTYIHHQGTGDLITRIAKDDGYFRIYGNGNTSVANFRDNAGVELFYNSSKKFETTSEGIQVTSSGIPSVVVKSTGSNRADVRILAQGTGHAYLWMDASNGDLSGADYAFFVHKNDTLDLELGNYANDIILKTRNGSLGSGGLNTAIHCHENGAVELYHDGTKFFETGSTANFARTIAPSTNGGFDLGLNATRWRHIRTVDNGKIMVGNSDDLQIYHDGSNSFVSEGGTGNLFVATAGSSVFLYNTSNSETLGKFTSNDSVELYYDGSKKFETTSNGALCTGILQSSNQGNILSQLNSALILKSSTNDAMRCNFLLEDNFPSGRGSLAINVTEAGVTNDRDLLLNRSGGRVGVRCTPTVSFEVSGESKFLNNVAHVDNAKAQFGNSNDLQIYHDGSESVIGNSTGTFQILSPVQMRLRASNFVFAAYDNSETLAKFTDNGSVQLYYDNSEKLYTTADGIESKGELHFKSPSNFNGEQTGRIEWWNENDAGVMAKIGVDRKANVGAPADLVFSTNQNVDTSANGSDGDITERGRFTNNGLRLTNQPCFYAYSNVTRNNYGGGLVVAYTATHHNQGNHYSTSTYRFTAPVDGIYVFGGNPGYVESGRTYSLYLRINGAVRTEVGRVVQGNFPSHSQFGFSVSVKLSANDYVDLYQLGRMHHNASYSAWWGYFLG